MNYLLQDVVFESPSLLESREEEHGVAPEHENALFDKILPKVVWMQLLSISPSRKQRKSRAHGYVTEFESQMLSCDDNISWQSIL